MKKVIVYYKKKLKIFISTPSSQNKFEQILLLQYQIWKVLWTTVNLDQMSLSIRLIKMPSQTWRFFRSKEIKLQSSLHHLLKINWERQLAYNNIVYQKYYSCWNMGLKRTQEWSAWKWPEITFGQCIFQNKKFIWCK